MTTGQDSVKARPSIVDEIVETLVNLYGKRIQHWRQERGIPIKRLQSLGTSVDEVFSARRHRPATIVRWAAWLWLYEARQWSVTAIARCWNRSHATVIEAIRKARGNQDVIALVERLSS